MASLWSQVQAAIEHEFSDLAEIDEITRVCVRLVVAMLLSGLIGYNRERGRHSAGLRTHMLVGLGSAIVMIVAAQSGASLDASARVIQGLLAGIGFLGAGAIIKFDSKSQVHGLTTAASIWVTATIGIAAGMGREWTAIIATAFVLLVLALLLPIERAIDRRQRRDSARHHDEPRREDDPRAEDAAPR